MPLPEFQVEQGIKAPLVVPTTVQVFPDKISHHFPGKVTGNKRIIAKEAVLDQVAELVFQPGTQRRYESLLATLQNTFRDDAMQGFFKDVFAG